MSNSSRATPGDVISDGVAMDRAALQAAIIIQSHILFTTWNQTGKEQGIKDVKTYLEKTKGLLKR